jgi:dienelactone hydrolase
MNPGDILSHYRIHGLLGAGGMGEVYRAEDTRLKRVVALKVLTPALSEQADAKRRLIVEAQAASALDHPNICTIYEIDETADGRVFLAMAHYEGETLAKRLARGQIPIGEAIDIALQLTRAVAAAHDAGVIHRDIKPANIFISAKPPDDAARVKLLDFGIAKLGDQTGLTRTGTTVGTIAYMAPEHVAGHAIDHRADIWSIGIVLHELLTGRRPFEGSNALAIMKSIAEQEPPSPSAERADAPAALDAIIRRALRKLPNDRYASARDLLADLEATRRAVMADTATMTVIMPQPRRTVRWVMAGATVLVAIAALAWMLNERVRANEITQTVSDLRTFVEREQYLQAVRRLHTLRPELAADPAIAGAARDLLLPMQIATDPPGAQVFIKGYDEPEAEWMALGTSPVSTRAWYGPFRWRITRDGYETFEGSGPPIAAGEMTFTLFPNGSIPPGMVPVIRAPGGRLPDFFIDKYEVTNKAYKAFVDAGGYRDQKYWALSFVKDGRAMTWAQAMAEFRDTTGRAGPATWELGTYPDGQDDHPVNGISWYEADAYARYAGKSLPTVAHWRAAALQSIHSQIVEWSNFSGKATARVGSYPSLGAWGTYDMAGNVKEWCENEVEGKRYVLGGGWNEPNYQYRNGDARAPFDRSANLGVRLMVTPDPAAVPADVHAPVARLFRDYSREKPVSDEVFAAYRNLYAYDPIDLTPTVESTEDAEAWRVERVSYATGYGNERLPSYLFLPKNAKPPYQAVVYFPHSGGLYLDSFQKAEMGYLGFLVKSGRALLFPMYKGMYERRRGAQSSGPNATRDQVIQQVKDVSRSVDYLLSRRDIAADKIAYFGVSLGANRMPIVLGVERRFQAGIMWSGGLPTTAQPPEIDPINFAPRVTLPVLMLNGRDDFMFPVQVSQEPLFKMFGTSVSNKRHGLYDGGHVFPFSRMIKDSLDWLDRYLGAPN